MTPSDHSTTPDDPTAVDWPDGPANGHYSDGQTAARHAVRIELNGGALHLFDAQGQLLTSWELADLSLVDEMTHVGDMRLSNKTAVDARLTITEGRLRRELVAQAPHLKLTKKEPPWRWVAYGLFGLVGLGFVIWYAIPGMAVAISHTLPKSWEVALGDQVYDQLTKTFVREDDAIALVCRRPDGVAALQGLTDRLAAHAEGDYPWRVEVWDFPVVNAFALPGGRIVLFRGLIDDASGPDAVAGVLAHEMGHVTERHGTAGLIKVLGLGFFFGVVLGDIGSGAVIAAGETLLQLSYGRDAERDADDRAVDLLTASGISSQGLADFFQQLERLEAGSIDQDKPDPETKDTESPDRKSNQDHDHDHDDWGGFKLPPYLSTHPASAERRATIQAAVDRHAAAKRSDLFTPSMSKTAWESLLDICPPGEKGRAGR